jgi:aryl-alcohol dehydrogenase-like predicted oxidoreductase
MEYRRLGDSGLIVSRLALGAMTFTSGTLDKVDLGQAGRLVGRAIDAGINLFDTADVYDRGDSESVLGQVLAPHRRDVVITTKAGVRNGRGMLSAGLSRRHILMSVEDSLRRLGTDWIDIYVVHVFDPLTPIDETLEALDAVVRAGKVRYLAFSNWPAWAVAVAMERQAANGWARFTHGQMYYSLLGRDIERDMLPVMDRYGLGLTVWSPLAFGFLSGKFTRETLAAEGSRFAKNDMLSFDKDHGFALLDRMRGIAAARGSSVPQVAYAWLLARPQVSSVLVGATTLEQLDDNLAAADLVLSPEDIAALDELTRPARVYPYWMIEDNSDRKRRQALAPIDRPGPVR